VICEDEGRGREGATCNDIGGEEGKEVQMRDGIPPVKGTVEYISNANGKETLFAKILRLSKCLLFLQSNLLLQLLQMLPVQLPSAVFSQSLSSLLGRDVPLRFSHQFITNQKLPNRRAAEQRWVEMHVEMTRINLLVCAFKGSLMDTGTYMHQLPFH
jgi:hypothetical protein